MVPRAAKMKAEPALSEARAMTSRSREVAPQCSMAPIRVAAHKRPGKLMVPHTESRAVESGLPTWTKARGEGEEMTRTLSNDHTIAPRLAYIQAAPFPIAAWCGSREEYSLWFLRRLERYSLPVRSSWGWVASLQDSSQAPLSSARSECQSFGTWDVPSHGSLSFVPRGEVALVHLAPG